MRDLDIRNNLKATRLKEYYSDTKSRVVEELSLCGGIARVDIAIINGSLHGYEIKSEKDTLIRLPNQIDIYSKVFNYLTVCVGERHVDGVCQIIPDWCGILVASNHKNALMLELIRKARGNQNVDKLSVAQLLWKNEVIEALNTFGVTKGLSNKSKKQLWLLFAQTASTEEVSSFVREKLKVRSNWRADL